MQRNLVTLKPLQSSFLSVEKDTDIILRRLFVENKPYSDELKKLLVVNTKDCLTNRNNQVYNDAIKNMDIKELKKQGYVSLTPQIRFNEHDEVKSYIVIGFNNFIPNPTNPQFRDCNVTFDVICHTDCWELDDYAIRPLKIVGYIDGLMNNSRLTGIGILNFNGCGEITLPYDSISAYTLSYHAVHWTDDQIPPEDED